MDIERKKRLTNNRYHLHADSPKVIYDTRIRRLSPQAQRIYLRGGYHSLVQRIAVGEVFQDCEQEAYFRGRIARELVFLTSDYHKDQSAVQEVVAHHDEIYPPGLNISISDKARSVASMTVRDVLAK